MQPTGKYACRHSLAHLIILIFDVVAHDVLLDKELLNYIVVNARDGSPETLIELLLGL
jgi:hypothetical protein